ncbi:MAG TPA: polysaccharide deacetylase family protein [Pirellulales bacterium]|nr:polysaccharide deacetylase family protein [Pirellulales bacterium]
MSNHVVATVLNQAAFKEILAMTLWRQLALNIYRRATLPYRTRHTRQLCQSGHAPISVVVFHRIADDDVNDWSTPTAAFIDSIHWLQDNFELISLAEAQRRMAMNANHRAAVCITFDDGYEVNCERALPMLIEQHIPCTYFVTAQPVFEGRHFAHDRGARGNTQPNTIDELRHLARAGIEIGAHSRTHSDLGQITDANMLKDEIVGARDDLQSAIGTRIRYFAFPFGRHKNLNAAAFHIARSAGFDGVLSAYGGFNFPGDDPFHIQRRGVDGPSVRAKNWVVIDPVRNRRILRFDYGRSSAIGRPRTVGA